MSELAQRFEVTSETIRRDLEILDRRGILRRVHGGAVMTERLSLVEPNLADREPAHAAQKNRIAQAALAQLPGRPDGSVILDAGSTITRLAALVRPGTVGTVVTNSLPAASQLAGLDQVGVQLLGGRLRGVTRSRWRGWRTCAAMWRSSAPMASPRATDCPPPTTTRQRSSAP